MNIRGIGIDGFGRFAGTHFEPLAPGLNVFYGSNEAGKSSLLAFIQTVLYGFPRQRRDAHYPPLNGGLHGGRLWLEKHDGLYVLQRRAAPKGKDLHLRLPGESETDSEEAVHQLLGGATREVYTTVFAFSLDELQEIGSLEPGKRADVVLLDGNGPELAVLHDPFQQIVYGATPRSVSEVWVDGGLRVTGSETVDVDRKALAAEAREAARELAIRGDMKGESAYAGKLDFEEGN